MRIVIAEDGALLRAGLATLLAQAGHEVVAAVGDGSALVAAVGEYAPDLAIVDVRMPPAYQAEGLEAAAWIRAEHPQVGVLVLSQHIEARHAVGLVGGGGFGYLLKDRVLDVEDFLDAARRVASGGSALDPAVVSALIAGAGGPTDPVGTLSAREREVLALMAEGRTNRGIATLLVLTERTVETHVRSILAKLGLPDSDDDHRRILAVLAHLRAVTRT